jgi:hypothetical protein
MLEQDHANIRFSVHCPNENLCSNTGSYGEKIDGFDPIVWHEVQCEFCYENKTSMFNMANYSDGFNLNERVTKDMLDVMLQNAAIDSTGLMGDTVTLTVRTLEKDYHNIPTREAHGKLVAVFKLDNKVHDEQYFTIHGKGRCLKHKVFDKKGKVIANLKEGTYLLFDGDMVGSHVVMKVE